MYDTNVSNLIYWENKNKNVVNWNSIFSFKIKNRVLNKIGQFQYKVLNNLICCKRNLHIWKLSNTNLCPHCKVVDDYEHFFISCSQNRNLWREFSDYCKTVKCLTFNPSLSTIIGGLNVMNKSFYLVNVLIEFVTFSIYKSKMVYNQTEKQIPNTLIFRQELKKLDQILCNSNQNKRIKIKEKEWSDCKVYWTVH